MTPSVLVAAHCQEPDLDGPAPVTVAPGSSRELTVVVSGGIAPHDYQWFEGASTVGTNSPTFQTPAL